MNRLAGLQRLRKLTEQVHSSYLIYNGENRSLSDPTYALNFWEIDTLFSGD